MIRRPPRSTQSRSSAASDVYKRQGHHGGAQLQQPRGVFHLAPLRALPALRLSLIHISEPTRLRRISYAVCCLKKKKKEKREKKRDKLEKKKKKKGNKKRKER